MDLDGSGLPEIVSVVPNPHPRNAPCSTGRPRLVLEEIGCMFWWGVFLEDFFLVRERLEVSPADFMTDL